MEGVGHLPKPQKPESADSAAREQYRHLQPYQWKPGQSGNPKGRAKGTRHRIQEAFLQDFLEAWLAFGRPALMAAAWTKPAEFVKVAASLMPKEVDQTITTINMDRMTDKQLAAIAFGSSGPPLEEAEDEGAVH